MLLGSGSGELTIASQGDAGGSGPGSSGPGSSVGPSGSSGAGWHFVLWNGKLSETHAGVPVAFARDGRRLAVLHPGSVSGGSVGGWLRSWPCRRPSTPWPSSVA